METGDRVITPDGDDGTIVEFHHPPAPTIGGPFVHVLLDRQDWGWAGWEDLYREYRRSAFMVGGREHWRRGIGVVLAGESRPVPSGGRPPRSDRRPRRRSGPSTLTAAERLVDAKPRRKSCSRVSPGVAGRPVRAPL